MSKLLYLVILFILPTCRNSAQELESYDRMPIDTTKWSVTDKFAIDLNSDDIEDQVLIFDKYVELTRPDDTFAPVLFYLGVKSGVYSFLTAAEKIIFSPHYEIVINNETFIINQKGMGTNNNTYINHYKLINGNIIMVRSIIIQEISKYKIDEKTGDVITFPVSSDTISNEKANIPAMKYDIFKHIPE